MLVWKDEKIEREAGDGPFKKLIELKFRLNYRPSARLDGGEATGYVAAGWPLPAEVSRPDRDGYEVALPHLQLEAQRYLDGGSQQEAGKKWSQLYEVSRGYAILASFTSVSCPRFKQ